MADPLCKNMSHPISSISYRQLWRIGLSFWHHKEADGGCIPNALDPGDILVAVTTPMGGVLHSPIWRDDSNYSQFYDRYRDIISGKHVSFRTSDHHGVTFRNGYIWKEERYYNPSANRRLLYKRGVPIRGEINSPVNKDYQPGPRDLAIYNMHQIIDYRRLVSRGSLVHRVTGEKTYFVVDHLTNNRTLLASSREAKDLQAIIGARHEKYRATPLPNGWGFRVHGMPVRLLWMRTVISGVEKYPPYLVRELFDYTSTEFQRTALTFSFVNKDKLKNDMNYYRTFLGVSESACEAKLAIRSSIIPKLRIDLPYHSSSYSESWLLQLEMNAITETTAAAFDYRSGDFIFYNDNIVGQEPRLRYSIHEIAHLLWHFLGEEAFEPFFVDYMTKSMDELHIPKADQLLWKESIENYKSKLSEIEGKRIQDVLNTLFEAGKIPTAYSGVHQSEFLAECTTYALLGREMIIEDNRPATVHFSHITDGIRQAMQASKSIDELREKLVLLTK